MTKVELLQRIEEQWHIYESSVLRLSEEQLTQPTDAAGWTIKDHLFHLALSEGIVLALLDGQPLHEYMGVDEDTYQQGDDAVNAVVQQRHQQMSLADVLKLLRMNHQLVVERIKALADEELQPIIEPLINNTFHHYEEHLPWIMVISQN